MHRWYIRSYAPWTSSAVDLSLPCDEIYTACRCFFRQTVDKESLRVLDRAVRRARPHRPRIPKSTGPTLKCVLLWAAGSNWHRSWHRRDTSMRPYQRDKERRANDQWSEIVKRHAAARPRLCRYDFDGWSIVTKRTGGSEHIFEQNVIDDCTSLSQLRRVSVKMSTKHSK